MVTRRQAVTALVIAPVAAMTSIPEETPRKQIIIPEPAFERIAKILAEGGKIHTISYSLPAPEGRVSGGSMFFTKVEEREWRIE